MSTWLRSAMLRSGSEDRRLLGLQLERCGLADDGVLAVLFLRRLIDRENADIGQDGFRDHDVGSSSAIRIRILLAPGKNDVDPVVGQNEAAGAGLRRNLGRDGAPAGGEE